MLKAIGWLIKASVFAALVLVAANYFKVGTKTVSDELKTQLSHAENAEVVGEVKDWAHRMTNAHRDGILKKSKVDRGEARTKGVVLVPQQKMVSKPSATSVASTSEEISSTERQKLRALMRELNSSRTSN
jgi:hypothetical protein